MASVQFGKLNRFRWNAYSGVRLPVQSTPLAIIVRARSEQAVRQIADHVQAPGYDIVWQTRKWWPSERRWELTARSTPVDWHLEAVDAWSETLAELLLPQDARLTHWVPVGSGPIRSA